jgi:hypothetical protein
VTNSNSFIFYQSFCDTTEHLSDEDYGKLMKAVHKYGIHSIEPENLPPVLMMVFGLMKPQIDANKRRRENGKQGGAPVGNSNARKQPVVVSCDDEKQANDNVNVNDNANENINDNQNDEESGAKAPENECEENKQYFIYLWQSHPDIFNITARIYNPNDFNYWWKKNLITRKEIDIAIKNVVDGVKSGAIERRFIPGSPDKFVINGWIQRSQESFVKKSGPSPPDYNDWSNFGEKG